MKHTAKILSFGLAIASLVACSSEDFTGAGTTAQQSVISASIDQSPQTRLSIDWAGTPTSTARITWDKGDAFRLYYISKEGDSETLTDQSGKYLLSEGAGTPSGRFVFLTGVSPLELQNTSTTTYSADVVFPEASVKAGTKVHTYTYTLPSEITLTDNTSSRCLLPMWGHFADVTSTSSLTFSHLSGVLKLTLFNVPAAVKTITVEADKALAGNFDVDLSTAKPQIVNTGSGSKKLTINLPASAADRDNSLYIPIPAGTYNSVKVYYGSTLTKEWTNKTVEAGTIYSASTPYTPTSSEENLKAGGDFETSGEIASIDLGKVASGLKNDLNITLNEGVKELKLGTTNAVDAAKHIQVILADGASYPTLTVNDGARYLQNVTIKGDINNNDNPVEGFNSGSITNIENFTIDGVKFKDQGIVLGDGVKSISNLTVKNSSAEGLLTTAFVKVAAKNYADNITIEGNTIKFADGAGEQEARIDGVNIWYMNGGTLTVRNNIQYGGQCLLSSIPANWKDKGTPDRIIVDGNKVYDNFNAAITIQYPNKIIQVTNNYVKSSFSAISFLFFRKTLQPDITITGNSFEPYVRADGGHSYVMIPFGFNTKNWGGNEEGSAAKIVIKYNVKITTVYKTDFAEWIMRNEADLIGNTVTLLQGSDVSKPYKN